MAATQQSSSTQLSALASVCQSVLQCELSCLTESSNALKIKMEGILKGVEDK